MIGRLALALMAGGLVVMFGVTDGLAMKAKLSSDMSGRLSYLKLKTNDPAADPTEDVQTTEGVATQLDLDNAYVHFDVRYQLVAGQLLHNPKLNYLEHTVVLNVDLDRWLEQHTDSGNIDITLALDSSPSLPSLQNDAQASAASPFGLDQQGTVSQELLQPQQGSQDLLNLRRNRSGYGYRYGLKYQDRAGALGKYHVGFLVRDSRYNGGVVPNQSALSVNGGYTHELLRGEAGITLGHKRFLRGADTNQQTYTVAGNYAYRAARYDWGGSLGTTYRTDNKNIEGRAGLYGSRQTNRIKVTGKYDTDIVVIQVGRNELRRRHHVVFKLEPARYEQGSVWFVASGSAATDISRAELGINQVVFMGDTSPFYAEVGYQWSGLWWDDPTTNAALQSTSNVIGFNFIWRFL